MARKRVDLKVADRFPADRQIIWQTIRELRRFHLKQIAHDAHTNAATVRTYLTGLTNAGYLKKHKRAGTTQMSSISIEWELINDVGVDAPRVTKDGRPVTQGQARENMWRTMKILKDFSPRELAMNATTEECEVKEDDARDYVGFLWRAKYLALNAKSKPGVQARYRFIPTKNTGPRPPMVQRIKQVFDPNIGKVVWSPNHE